MSVQPSSMLRIMFIVGATVDGAIAASWFLIASGVQIPNILNGYVGAGSDYQLAMYVAAMFMMGWASLLVWGAIRPLERRGLLLITSAFLILSVVFELMFYGDTLGGGGLAFGVAKRIVLSSAAIAVYVYSSRHEKSTLNT
jgi:uncharacterized membrane protein YciS (DUF1049 family)